MTGMTDPSGNTFRPCGRDALYSNADVELRLSDAPVPYPEAVEWMEARAGAIAAGEARECLWLLEHPPLYTAGTSARPEELLSPDRFPVYRTGRGGQHTYHGPGQRVAYFMLDLRERGRDVRCFVSGVEQVAIDALAALGVEAERREGRVGVWVTRDTGREEKVAAIGIRVRRWVSFHGLSLNVAPDLSHFEGIVPCGIREHGVASLRSLGIEADMKKADRVLLSAFRNVFGPVA